MFNILGLQNTRKVKDHPGTEQKKMVIIELKVQSLQIQWMLSCKVETAVLRTSQFGYRLTATKADRKPEQFLLIPPVNSCNIILPSSHKKTNLILDVIYRNTMNLDIHLSKFIVLECVTSHPRFVFLGQNRFFWDGESTHDSHFAKIKLRRSIPTWMLT